MRCTGIRKATNETCGSPVYYCKNCGNQGCNQGGKEFCDHQAFHVARCTKCNKLGTNRLVEDKAEAG
ncbi:MAG: hypothetical protein U0230_26725 [Polyangiales bacterium]